MGDGEFVEEEGTVITAGERLRQAREAAGLTLEEIATSTRIPTRHLESLEASDFSRLPAPTYSIGFAKNYAGAVGLDRAEIGEQLRAEMGGSRPTSTTPAYIEPADPARAMPRWLIAAAIVAIIVAALVFNWLNNRSLEGPDEAAVANEAAAIPAPQQQAPAPPAAQGQGPVVLSATDNVWLQVKDGAAILKQGVMAAGETFEVPATAVAPMLTTAKPEALRINVGTTVAPPIGEPAKKVTVSLKAEDLLKPKPAVTDATTPSSAPVVAPPPTAAPTRRAPAPARQPAATPPPAAEPQANTAAPVTNAQ
jgi:cytoskeletal protein RodZ